MDNLLLVDSISKSYMDNQALTAVSFSIPKQNILGLLGPNGAGKTTLIRIITQIIAQDKGKVFLDKQPIQPSDIRKIGYLPEERGLYKNMKVGEQLMFFAKLKGMNNSSAKTEIKKWLDILGATDWWHKPVADLSKGMSQKIQFILAVVHKPQLLILDEPFTGFDPVNADLIKQHILKLKAGGTTIIFSTHRMETVEEMCDKVVMINQSKKIIDATPLQLRQQYKTNMFNVVHNSTIDAVCTANNIELIKSVKNKYNTYDSTLRTTANQSPNAVLQILLQTTQIHSFAEQVMTMGEIFINQVQRTSNG